MKRYLLDTFRFNDSINRMMIRKQGLEPDFVDYIGTRYRRQA